MKHAFLIIAHNNWWQLKEIIKLLDAPNHDIYVHIDKKAKNFDISYYYDIVKKSNVKFFQEYEVYWGCFSMVLTEIFLFEKSNLNKYDYYHVISGADLPLKNNDEIDAFFELNKGKEFIVYNEKALKNNPEISKRTKYYHFLQNYKRKYKEKWKNEIFTFLERVSLVCQIVFHIDRIKDLDWIIKYGSQWISITNELVEVILHHKEKIEKVFTCTNCADELFVQTIAYNCGFKDKIYQPIDNQSSNVRFIDWSRGKNGNPYTFRTDDLKILFPENGCNNNLFARKFSEQIDKYVIDKIIEKLSIKDN